MAERALEIRTEIQAHKRSVNVVEFSPDGDFLVSAGGDGLVKLWRPGEWELFSTFFGHRKSANDLSFGPDGRILASSSADGTVRIWSFPFGSEEDVRKGLRTAWISPDGETVASLDREDRIRLWSLEDRRTRERLEHADAVTAAAFEPDGDHLLAATERPGMVRWRVGTGEAVDAAALDGGSPAELHFLDGGERLVASGRRGQVRIFETGRWDEGVRIDVDADGHAPIAPLPDRAGVAVAGARRLRIHGAGSGRMRREIEVPEADVRSIACSPDGRWLVAAAADRRILVWERA